MKSLRVATALGVLLLGSTVTARASETVEEVIAKHIEAHGGRQAWDAVESIRTTGEFTGFSKIAPFTLLQQRDRNYLLDHVLGEKQVTIGFDGETIWWENHWFQKGALRVDGPADLAVLERDFDFVTPLFDIDEYGYEVKLLDESDLDGEPVIAIELKRSDESSETWYLNPETYLEFARVSPGSDFGRPMPQRTYFDDFRQVGDVTLPFYLETQWYTRHRIMEVADVQLNVEIDQGAFAKPAPLGMADLIAMAGDWAVSAESRQAPNAPWASSSYDSTITSDLGGVIVQEHYRTAGGTAVVRSISYDRNREHWVLTAIDERGGLLDIQTGTANDDGAIQLSNVDTGTTEEMFGQVVHSRSTLIPVDGKSFRVERESSIDAGENWFVAQKLTYQRKSE